MAIKQRMCVTPSPRRNYPPRIQQPFLQPPAGRVRRVIAVHPSSSRAGPSESIPFVFPLMFPVERAVPIHRRFARTPLRRS